MNPRDLSEIKRRLNPDKRNPTVIYGCYVGADGHVISDFAQPVVTMPQEENEKYMAIFKRALSGTLGQNLCEIEFTPMQVMEGEEHKLLTALRESGLKDGGAIEQFYQRVIAYVQTLGAGSQSVSEEQTADNYLILLMHDAYDVPYKDRNGENDMERATDVFHYIISCVCPVRQTKPTLSYFAAESEFHSRASDWVVGAPELGFMFPAFEDRAANLYKAMFYTRDSGDMHEEFIQAIFGTDNPMPAKEQEAAFQAILQDTLADECSLDVVQAVHDTVRGMLLEQKADRSAEPLCLGRHEMKTMLEECGVSPQRAEAFEEQYGQTFGVNAVIPAVNVVAPKKFTVTTPSVVIRVDPEHSDLIETRVIDGKCYIMVLADGNVEVNGVSVRMEGPLGAPVDEN